MMIKFLLIFSFSISLTSPLNANFKLLEEEGIDKEFSEERYWWTPYYKNLLDILKVERSYALVIGVGKYDNPEFASLPSESDAKKIKDYLINNAGFDHVHLLTGNKVTLNRVRSLVMDYYSKKIKKNDRFLFYWSGHGVTPQQTDRDIGYLSIKDSRSNTTSSMLSMLDVANWNKHHIKAKHRLYIIDSCFSGIAASKAASSALVQQTVKRVSQPSSQILVAGQKDEQTIAIEDLKGGVFTTVLLEGLNGRADYDNDGVIVVRELELYVRKRVDQERLRVGWPSPITPSLYNFSQHQGGDFFFVQNKEKMKNQPLFKNQKPLLEGVIPTGLITSSKCQHGNCFNGYGTLIKENGTKYTGNFKSNKYHGQGRIIFKNGNFYTGGFHNSKYHGSGEYSFKGSYNYKGNWKNNEFHGQGTKKYTSGHKFQGNFLNGKRNGQGTMIYPNGSRYTGAYSADKRSGQGTMIFKSGEKYTGGYSTGKRNGQGTMILKSGGKYTGQWKNDAYSGQGTMIFKSGEKYTGQWKNSKMNGQGTMIYPNGARYTGQWKNGAYSGQGIMILKSGARYTGQWQNSKRNGQGTMIYSNGARYTGQWQNGRKL